MVVPIMAYETGEMGREEREAGCNEGYEERTVKMDIECKRKR